MLSSIILSLATLFSLAHCHAVIISAIGEAGSGASVGFGLDASIARNCSNISPCQLDTVIIRDAEINEGIADICGRTELNGSIDITKSIQNAVSANEVTKIQPGTTMTVTLHQVNQDGAGPFTCELFSSASNSSAQKMTVVNDVPGSNGLSQAKFHEFNITVLAPTEFDCSE
ncbi:hypothetical protein TD95_001073, partial [Thielaviopsis punctulata]